MKLNFFILCFLLTIVNANIIHSQTIIKDSLSLIDNAKNHINSFKDSLQIENPYVILGIGYLDVYMGNNQRGNKIMELALDRIISPDADIYHELSVQNTKNGNYQLAFNYLEKSAKLNPEVYGYFGWVMLYYYRDYKRALEYLNVFDLLTPNFSDFPMGENIHYLKGLALMKLDRYEDAINNFEIYINEETSKNGESWVETSTFYYKGICLENLNKKKQAVKNYKLAIKYNSFFVEAIYRKALLVKRKRIKKLLKVKELIKKGYSKTDVYVETFYPVYIQDVEKELGKYEF